MIFVAVDDDGRPTPAPQLPAGDEEDLEQKASAVRRIDLRAQVAAAMAEQSYTEASTAPRVVLRFLAAPLDVNFGGRVHGGVVMRWVEEAAQVLVTAERAFTSACTSGRVARRRGSGG
jgi:4-hydroxybenzoyl-CoA thioesterase